MSTNGNAFNMGYIQSKPVVVGDGTLVIRYRNGDICHKGTPQESHRSTRITFMCSLVEVCYLGIGILAICLDNTKVHCKLTFS